MGAGYVVGGEEGDPVSGEAGEGEVVLAGEVYSGWGLDDSDAVGVAGAGGAELGGIDSISLPHAAGGRLSGTSVESLSTLQPSAPFGALHRETMLGL